MNFYRSLRHTVNTIRMWFTGICSPRKKGTFVTVYNHYNYWQMFAYFTLGFWERKMLYAVKLVLGVYVHYLNTEETERYSTFYHITCHWPSLGFYCTCLNFEYPT